MLFSKATFIGIDPSAGKQPFVYAAIDHERNVLALGQGGLEEVLAFVGGQQNAFVGVNAPQRPNQGLMAQDEVRRKLNPPPRPRRWTGFRVAEYELGRRGVRIPRTPGEGQTCAGWMQMGFTVFQRLKTLGYRPFPAGDNVRQAMEVYPHGTFTVLLGKPPFSKHTLEGRLQRQLVLYQQDMELPDPMRIFEEITRFRLLNGVLPLENIYSPQELDALVAAFTAWRAATNPGDITMVGDLSEGQIVLPVGELKSHY